MNNMKKFLLTIMFCFSFSLSAMAMTPPPPSGNHGGTCPSQGAVPEPMSILLILGGLGVAYGAKKIIDK